jgi:starch synthase
VQPYGDQQCAHLRRANKLAVAERFGLDGVDGPLFCVVSRLTDQKGMDLLLSVVDGLVVSGCAIGRAGIGRGRYLEGALFPPGLGAPSRRKVSIITGYNEELSHLMQGGRDAILIPSRFEPCGLTQLYGLRYGCVPVVSRIGGLADTVIDANPAAIAAEVATGVMFDARSAHALFEAIRRTARALPHLHELSSGRKCQRRGMKSRRVLGNQRSALQPISTPP